ncbi:MAG: AraC family transcriptional regulator [Pirellulaceae bacterium]|mgnify:CR=1 FL=1|nr:AraC family transcriptional regulator [Pirellulaceae bacterium]
MTIPIYQERGRKFAADACRPVTAAAQAGKLRHEALVHGHYPGRRLPRNALCGVKSLGYWDADRRQDWGLEWHRNEGIELTFLESGSLGFAVDDRSYRLKSGDLTFTRPWQLHCVGDPCVGPGRLHFLILDVGVRRPHQPWRWPKWIVLTDSDLRQLTDFLRHNEQPVWRAVPEVAQCFARIAVAVEADRNGNAVSRLAVHINQLFIAVLEMFRRRDVKLDKSLSSARRTVELFWNDLRSDSGHLAEEWTVRKMARQCGMGATNFIHFSKQLNNATPMRYLNRLRLAAAAKLLREEPERSVTEIALDCGFASSQYFATLFRGMYGLAPRVYRSPSTRKIAGG